MMVRNTALAIFLSFSLSACASLDALVNEAVAWLEDARSANLFEPANESTLANYQTDEPDDGEKAYDDLDDILVDEGNKAAFENSIKVVLFPVDNGLIPGKIEVDDRRLYIEFKPNDAFIAIKETERSSSEIKFEADVDFDGTGDELIITVNPVTRQATVTRKDPASAATLVLADRPRRVVGVDFDGNGKADVNLYSDDVREGGKGRGKPWEDDD
jgi:hypothetical protein